MVKQTPNGLNPQKNLTVTAVKIVDINEKLLKYVVISNEKNDKVVICIGNKNFQKILELITNKKEENEKENIVPKRKG